MSLHKSGKVLRGDAREIVYSIIQYFEEEKKSKRYHPYKHSNLRAALATGLSASTISKIKKEGKLAEQSQTKIQTPSKGNRGRNNTRVALNIAALCNIREIIATLYDANEIPTVIKIVKKAKEDFNIHLTLSTLRRILKDKLGFIYKKLPRNRKLLLETDSVKAQRARYLRRIRNNDALKVEKKAVIYIGESWVDVIQNKIKGKKSAVQRYFIIHAGSETEYLKEALYIFKAEDNINLVSSSEFLNYVQEKLIPNLPKGSILVVDNAACHNSVLNKVPSRIASKNDIKKWMVDNYIPFDEKWTKPEMIEHLKNNTPEKEYELDNLVTIYGNEVLRLPPCNFDLNPIDRLWDMIKERVKKIFDNIDEAEVDDLARKVGDLVKEEEWKKETDNVKKAERKYWLREVIREENLENFVMSLGANSDDDTDDLSKESSSSDESIQETELSIYGFGEDTSK